MPNPQQGSLLAGNRAGSRKRYDEEWRILSKKAGLLEDLNQRNRQAWQGYAGKCG